MARNKTKGQLETELRVLRKARFSEGTVAVFLSVIRWGAIVLIARYAYMAIDTLAGKTTIAELFVQFFSQLEVSTKISWVVAVGGFAYGWKQRRLRKDTVERLQSRIQALEKRTDPGRSTSHLTPRGDTRPEDRV